MKLNIRRTAPTEEGNEHTDKQMSRNAYKEKKTNSKLIGIMHRNIIDEQTYEDNDIWKDGKTQHIRKTQMKDAVRRNVGRTQNKSNQANTRQNDE